MTDQPFHPSRDIENASKLTKIFGEWPEFGSAGVVAVHLEQVNADVARVYVDVYLMRLQDGSDQYQPPTVLNRLLATLRFDDARVMRSYGFGNFPSLFELEIKPTAPENDVESGGRPFEVWFDGFFAGLELYCRSIAVARVRSVALGPTGGLVLSGMGGEPASAPDHAKSETPNRLRALIDSICERPVMYVGEPATFAQCAAFIDGYWSGLVEGAGTLAPEEDVREFARWLGLRTRWSHGTQHNRGWEYQLRTIAGADADRFRILPPLFREYLEHRESKRTAPAEPARQYSPDITS